MLLIKSSNLLCFVIFSNLFDFGGFFTWTCCLFQILSSLPVFSLFFAAFSLFFADFFSLFSFLSLFLSVVFCLSWLNNLLRISRRFCGLLIRSFANNGSFVFLSIRHRAYLIDLCKFRVGSDRRAS